MVAFGAALGGNDFINGGLIMIGNKDFNDGIYDCMAVVSCGGMVSIIWGKTHEEVWEQVRDIQRNREVSIIWGKTHEEVWEQVRDIQRSGGGCV